MLACNKVLESPHQDHAPLQDAYVGHLCPNPLPQSNWLALAALPDCFDVRRGVGGATDGKECYGGCGVVFGCARSQVESDACATKRTEEVGVVLKRHLRLS